MSLYEYIKFYVDLWFKEETNIEHFIKFISGEDPIYKPEKHENAILFRYDHIKEFDLFLSLTEISAYYNEVEATWNYSDQVMDSELYYIAQLYMCGVIVIDFSSPEHMRVGRYEKGRHSRDGNKSVFLERLGNLKDFFLDAWRLYGYEDIENPQLEHEVMPDTFDTYGCDLSDVNVYNCQVCDRKYARILDWICDIRKHDYVKYLFDNEKTKEAVQICISMMKCLCGLEGDVDSMYELINIEFDVVYDYVDGTPYSGLVYAYVCGVLYLNLEDPKAIQINTRGDQNWSEILIFLSKLGDQRKLFFNAVITLNPELQPTLAQPQGLPDIDPSFLQYGMDTSDSFLPFSIEENPNAPEIDFGELDMAISDHTPIEKCPKSTRDYISRYAEPLYIDKVKTIYNVDITTNRDLFRVLKLDPCVGHFRLKVDHRINLYMDLIYISIILMDDLDRGSHRKKIIKCLFYDLTEYEYNLAQLEQYKIYFMVYLYISGSINIHYNGTMLLATRKDIKLAQFNRKPPPIFNTQIGKLAPLFELAWRTYEGGCATKLIL